MSDVRKTVARRCPYGEGEAVNAKAQQRALRRARRWRVKRWIALAETVGTNALGGRVDYDGPGLWTAEAWNGPVMESTSHAYKSEAKRAVERWLAAHQDRRRR